MKEWTYTFDSVSKKAWIEQIEKDLRGKSLDSLMGEWWPGESLEPLLHQEDAFSEVVRLPDELFAAPPRMTEFIEVGGQTAVEVNARIMNALQFGAEVLLIETPSLSHLELAEWLKEVHLNMVNVQIQPTIFSPIQDTTLKTFLANGIDLRIVRDSDSETEFPELLKNINDSGVDLNSIRFVYNFPSEGIWDDSTATTLNLLLKDFEHWLQAGKNQNDFFKKIILHLEGDSFYFKLIIQTRALHLVWQNLLAHFNIDVPSDNFHYLECHIQGREREEPDQYLIRASMSGLAASMAGTQGLCMHPLQGNNIEHFYKRTIRNIHHLLHLESNMYLGTDPLAGAYALDFYTTGWTKKIWERLRLEN